MEMSGNDKEFVMEGNDGKKIHIFRWDSALQPRAVIQIFHGMAEHAARYERFAEFLNRNGFIVYADDHRGHGRTAASPDELGYIGKDGFNRTVQDEHDLTGIIKEKHPGLPVIILGHSYGSFLAQDYITRFGNEIRGVILSGSAAKRDAEVASGKIITAVQKKLFGDRKKSRLMNYLSFGRYNRRIEKPRDMFAWLSRDDREVRKYKDDPFCGTVCSIGFFYDFIRGLWKLCSADRVSDIPKELPVYICSGGQDPVGGYGKSVRKLYEIYGSAGICDIELKLYPGARHEILNEINRDEVFGDILEWIEKHI